MSLNDFFHWNELKNKATSNMKNQQVLCSIGLSNVGIHLRDGPVESDIGIVSLHPSKGTHWVVNIKEINSDSFGCSPPQKLSKFIIKRSEH